MTDQSTNGSIFGYTPVGPPRGITTSQFERVLAAVELCWKARVPGDRSMPSIEIVQSACNVPRRLVVKILTSREGKEALLRRGIKWSVNMKVTDALAPEQIYALSILTDPTIRKPMNEKLRMAGITHSIYQNWLKHHKFAEAIRQVSETVLQDNIGMLNTRLVERADAGDLQAMKLMYEITGRYNPQQQQSLDMQRIVALLLEVITRHVTDTNVLSQISSDIAAIQSGGKPSALSDLPNNYDGPEIEDAEVVEPEPIIPVDGSKVVNFELPEDFFS